MNKLLITKTTSFEEIRQIIGNLREQKGKERETLKLIDESLSFGHDFVANLYFEKALVYQHLKSISEMEEAVLKAKFYIDKYKLISLKTRFFTFLGKVEDLKGRYDKAAINYKKAGKSFEVLGHLSYSMIMSGQSKKGYKLAKDIYQKFFESKEGKELKKKNYNTWAVWMSGITIRTVNAILDKKLNFDLKEVEKWISDTEKYLNIKDKFSYRKQEVKELWTRLKN